MLEEALRSSSTAPADTALAMISFLQEELPAGASAAEARFFHLFPLLLDRVFGPLIHNHPPDQYPVHEYGGWLSRPVRWRLPPPSMLDGVSTMPSSSRTRATLRNSSFPSPMSSPRKTRASILQHDPVVALLGFILMEAISKETDHRPGVRFPFPFLALPKATQASWLDLIAMDKGKVINATSVAAVDVRDNARRLLGELFRVPIAEQTQLRAFQAKGERKSAEVVVRRPLQLSPGHHPSLNSISPMVQNLPYKTTSNASTAATTSTESSAQPPMAMLSMLEIYLFLFIRYPLAAPIPAPQAAYPYPPHHRQVPEHWGDSVYEYLFRQYLTYFLPTSRASTEAIAQRKLLQRRDSELFLRIVMELWMESQVVVTPIGKVAKGLQEHQSHYHVGIGGSTTSLLAFGLNMSFDLTQAKYESPPRQIQSCTLLLIKHIIADPAVKAACDPEVAMRPDANGLSGPMTVLQQSFYNYVRGSLRHAHMHVHGSAFYNALEQWLIWLEPWNVTRSASGTKQQQQYAIYVPHSKWSDRSKYTALWEPYILANLHIYTVPLAIFLRRSRELDFSSRAFDRSLIVVQRVFRIFTPSVVDVIERGLSSLSRSSAAATATSHHVVGGRYDHLVQKHQQNLGLHSPSILGEPLTLASCQDDMHCLLEEIYLQHRKAVKELDMLDRFAAYVESFVGKGRVSGEEKALAHLVDQARYMVQFAVDYEVIPKVNNDSSRTAFGVASRSSRPEPTLFEDSVGEFDDHVERTLGGLLTAKSKQLVLAGAIKCDPYEDVPFLGDPMVRSVVKDHEIGFLVPLTIRLSHWLNAKLGIYYSSADPATAATVLLDPDDPLLIQKLAKETEDVRKLLFRFNLRFLADYKNLLFIALAVTQLILWMRMRF